MTTYTWDEAKRKSNLRKHGLDFADAATVIEGKSYTEEDMRYHYAERRYLTIGYFEGKVVVVVFTEEDVKYASSHLETQPNASDVDYWDRNDSWGNVMPIPGDDEIKYDEDSPPLESGFYANGVHRIHGRALPPRTSPLDPIDPEVLAFMQTQVPEVQMDPHILGGMPVFRGTLVPIKRMFDYLLAGKTIDDFLTEFPTVPRATAHFVLETEATMFYEAISKAMECEATLTSLSK